MKKFKRDYRLSKTEFIKFQLDQTINHSTNLLNQTEITVLAYVYIHGVNAAQELLKDRILTNSTSIINYISRLTRAGYLIKEPKLEADHRGKKGYSDISINPDIVISEDGFIQVSVVTLDPDSDQVYHPNFRK